MIIYLLVVGFIFGISAVSIRGTATFLLENTKLAQFVAGLLRIAAFPCPALSM